MTTTSLRGKAVAPLPNPAVTPEAVDIMRRNIFGLVQEALPEARKVLSGEAKWSPVQLNLFKTLLSKVSPDIHHSQLDVNISARPLDELSYEELMAIAQKANDKKSAIIDVTPTEDDSLDTAP